MSCPLHHRSSLRGALLARLFHRISTHAGWLGAIAVTLSAVLPAQSADPPRRPNIVLIMADDLGYECITANGGQSYRTPNLDKLAATGMRFERCHVQPLCTPTRVQLMTGLSNKRNYVRFGHIDPTATTFAHPLKKAGYATMIAGKWQLAGGPDLPQQLGFDESVLWQQTRRPPRYANPGLEYNRFGTDLKEKDFSNGEYGPDLVNDAARKFVATNKDRPFFIYYPMILTHDPYQPTPDSPDWDPSAVGEKVNRKPEHFADMVAYMDKLIGILVAQLDESGVRDNTLIIFLGDNGTGRGVVSKFRGQNYAGGKASTTTHGTHVPLIANWPGMVPTGKVCPDLVDSTDFFPTICEAAGVPVPTMLDGQSFLPQLRGEPGTPRDWRYCWYPGKGKLAKQSEFAADKRYKLYQTGQFFDVIEDPREKAPLRVADLSSPAATAAKKLQDALDQYADIRPVLARD